MNLPRPTPLSPAEACQWCDGKGVTTANANFLLARLRAARDYRWVGTSSDAMVVAAMTGQPPTCRPYDGWDLGRCLITRAVAPAHLHDAMDTIIEGWTQLLDDEQPFHGVQAARKMLAEERDGVRATIAARSEEANA